MMGIKTKDNKNNHKSFPDRFILMIFIILREFKLQICCYIISRQKNTVRIFPVENQHILWESKMTSSQVAKKHNLYCEYYSSGWSLFRNMPGDSTRLTTALWEVLFCQEFHRCDYAVLFQYILPDSFRHG